MRNLVKFFLIAFLLVVLLSSISWSVASPILVVEETELVKVTVDTFDPDGDNVTVVYSAPLDEFGEWQTNYGDAGNYTTIVTVTDGKDLTEKEYTIIVKKKNQAPEIEVKEMIEAVETETVKLKPKITDPNGDKVKVEISAPFNEKSEWQTGYDDAGEYAVTIKASDGELESTRVVKIIVKDKNREPKIETEPNEKTVEIKELESTDFSVKAADEDGDELVYLWQLDEEVLGWENTFSYTADYESAGTHDLKLIVSDGVNEMEKSWQITVENVNRAPVLPEFEDIVLKEGENLTLDLPETDEDGDVLTYSIDEPIGDDGIWQTGFEEAGDYEVDLVVSDGELTAKGKIKILVEDVDRAPEFFKIEDLEVDENEKLKIDLAADDPDGDEIYFLAYDFPEGAVLEGKGIIWQPSYDFVKRPDAFWARWLNHLRLDKSLWQTKELKAVLMACGKELCVNQTIQIKVNNVNRAPELTLASKVTLNETDKVRVKPAATDPDGDYVKFYFTEPLDKKGEWRPNYGGKGNYMVIVGASDGKTSVEKSIELLVKKVNRQPEMGKITDRSVNEGEDVWVKLEASDPDGDELEAWLEGAPENSSFKEQFFHWVPSYDTVTEKQGGLSNLMTKFKWLNRRFGQEKQYFGVNFVVSDGDFIVSKLINIAVRNWNQAPVLVNVTEATQAYVGEPVYFGAEAIDVDSDELTYSWDFGLMKGGVDKTNKITRRFSSPGEKMIRLTVSDGRDSVEKVWRVLVQQKAKPVEEAKPASQPVAQPQPQPVFVTYEI